MKRSLEQLRRQLSTTGILWQPRKIVIRLVGKKKIIVIATQRKIRDLADGALKVDTGDPEVDEHLRGYFKVIIDYGMWRMVKVI